MNTTFLSKKINIADSFKQKANEKFKKLDRFFDDASATVKISPIKERIIVEVTVKYNNMLFRAEKTESDKTEALDGCIDTIIRQIRKNKTKLKKTLHESAPDMFEGFSDVIEEEEHEVVKYKKFVVRPMDVEEAILQMQMLGHEFFMFRNVQTNDISVVYVRKDGKYAVLEPVN
jgi:putative sigma-54 modulation protein